MILQGAKATKEKAPKGAADPTSIVADSSKPEEPSTGKPAKGKGKRAAKNS